MCPACITTAALAAAGATSAGGVTAIVAKVLYSKNGQLREKIRRAFRSARAFGIRERGAR